MIFSSGTSLKLRREADRGMAGTSAAHPNFLVIRLSSFGDVVLAEPVTREIKRAFPESRVYFCTREEYAAIPSLFAGVDRVVGLGRRKGRLEVPAGLEGVTFDAAIDLQGNLRSGAVARRLRVLRKLTYRRQLARRFCLVYLPWAWKGRLKHTVELYLAALKPLGIAAGLLAPRVEIPADIRSEAANAVGPLPVIAICPGASSRHKSWGEERFATLARELRARGFAVLVLGSESDRAAVEEVAARSGEPAVRKHVTNDVRRTAAALSLCAAAASNDSGLMHLAAAVDTPVVSIFGPTSPALGFAPLGEECVAVSRNLPCSPCSYHGNRPCRLKSRVCMEEIDANEVASIVEGVAKKHQDR